MILTFAAALALPILAAAHGDDVHRRHAHLEARQGTAPPAPPAPPPPATTAPPPATTAPPVPPVLTSTGAAGTGTTLLTGNATSTTSFTFHLAATNPTAVPLVNITANQASSMTIPLPSTAIPGSVPTFIPGAPALPNPILLNPANYPALDKVPPTDSPEVQAWIQEVANTGVVIPQLSATNLGGCPNNTAILGDTSRCWWTCGGCTRPTDITDCPTAMDWGLTYDDGPAFYTPNLLQYLDEKNLKSTFFVVGSRVISFPATLQSQYMGQHQIAVHTWSHPSLTTLTNDQIIAELGWSRKVIKDTLGVTPNMMRPPFGDIDDRVRAISIAMGLQPVIWSRISPLATFDTDDFNIHSGKTPVGQVLQNWENIIGNATTRSTGFIVLEHDLFEESVEVATGYILPDALAHNPPFTIQPVVSCLKKDMRDAYIETNDNSTNPPVISSPGAVTISPTGAGGGAGGSKHTGAASALNVQFNAAGLGLVAATGAVGAVLSGAMLFL